MNTPDTLLPPADVVINASALDFYDSSEGLYEVGAKPEAADADGIDVPEDVIVRESLAAILSLKHSREAATTAVDLQSPHATESLRQDRADALQLMGMLADDIQAGSADTSVAYYGFADVAGLGSHAPDYVYRSQLGERPLLVRAEETLAPRANKLVSDVQAALRNGTSETATLSPDGDSVVRTNQHGDTSTISLRGYTFNRSGMTEEERQTFPRFPSCETFMGAGILEQLEYGERVIRIIPASMKNREHDTRHLLEIAGHTDLNVLTAVVSDSGDVQSVIPWTSRKDDTSVEMLRPLIQQHKAHAVSGQVAEQIHNEAFSEHRQLYEEFNNIPGSANIAPSKLLDYELITERIHEFFSRPYRAAPIYEAHRLTPAKSGEAITNLAMAAELFGHTYQPDEKPVSQHPRTIERFADGVGTNDVLYTRVVIAGKREEEAYLMGESDEISLVGYFVHEKASDELEHTMRTAPSDTQTLLAILREHPPRYMLLEGARLKAASEEDD